MVKPFFRSHHLKYFIALGAGFMLAAAILRMLPASFELTPHTPLLILGGYFFFVALRGFNAEDSKVWAKKFFVASLIYLTALFAALIIDAL